MGIECLGGIDEGLGRRCKGDSVVRTQGELEPGSLGWKRLDIAPAILHDVTWTAITKTVHVSNTKRIHNVNRREFRIMWHSNRPHPRFRRQPGITRKRRCIRHEPRRVRNTLYCSKNLGAQSYKATRYSHRSRRRLSSPNTLLHPSNASRRQSRLFASARALSTYLRPSHRCQATRTRPMVSAPST